MPTGAVPRKASIDWMDLSLDDVRQAREFLRGLQDEGVLDELGFGIMQSAFADRFYPATNTQMTRSRYLYFLPAIFAVVEREVQRRLRRPGDVAQRVLELQDALRAGLVENEDTGVIGRDAKELITRPPASIYWSALGELAILAQPLSERSLLKEVAARSGRRAVVEDDDGTAHLVESAREYWDIDLPRCEVIGAEGQVDRAVSFSLSRREARDLMSRYERHPTGPQPSLLLHLVRLGASAVDTIPYPWKTPETPPDLGRLLRHAEALSVFARGVSLQYHLLLHRAREAARLPMLGPDVVALFQAWWDGARQVLASWDRQEFLGFCRSVGALRGTDANFVDAWAERCLATKTPQELLNDRNTQDWVRAREHEKRPYKARLRSPRHLAQWKPPKSYGAGEEVLYELWYRHDVGRRFAEDITTGLHKGT